MPTFDLSDEERLATARAEFATARLSDELLGGGSGEGTTVAAARLFRYAQRGAGPDDLALERLLRSNSAARNLYRGFIAGAAQMSLPQAMAASSDEIPARDVPGCRISATRSRAEPGQFIVVIELRASAGVSPTALVLCDAEANCRHFPLPPARRDVIQLIEQDDSELLRLLADPRTEAFLL